MLPPSLCDVLVDSVLKLLLLDGDLQDYDDLDAYDNEDDHDADAQMQYTDSAAARFTAFSESMLMCKWSITISTPVFNPKLPSHSKISKGYANSYAFLTICRTANLLICKAERFSLREASSTQRCTCVLRFHQRYACSADALPLLETWRYRPHTFIT